MCPESQCVQRDLGLEKRRSIETIQHIAPFDHVQPLLERLYTL